MGKRMKLLSAVLTACLAALGAGPATQPAAAPQIEKPGWRLTFHDEFDGSRLDAAKWSDHYWHGRTHANRELEYYAPDGYELKDGMLRLIARPVAPEDRGKTQGLPYTSGMIEGSGKFSQKYGWFEVRCRVPAGKGFWPAFWLLPATRNWPPEIDVLEILGHDPATVYFTTHWRDPQRKHLSDGHRWKGPDFSADFHTFAVDWEPGTIIWYVDGVERARTDKGVPDEPMYMIANLAVGGDWPGNPDAQTVFPGAMEIDYIRVYQRPAATSR
jgi:beta-glucanase (GH16 family)